MRTALLFLVMIKLIGTGWANLPSSTFYRYSSIHSRMNLYYRFFQNQPLYYEIGIEGKIPFALRRGRASSLTNNPSTLSSDNILNALTAFGLETTWGYTYISRGLDQHRYFVKQSWYGDNLHATIGYGFTHRINPLSSLHHELPFSWGGLVGNWEFALFGTLNWRPVHFLPLIGGSIAYFFYTHPETYPSSVVENYFSSPAQRIPTPHRMDIAVYQTSKTSIGLRHTYQFSLTDTDDYSPYLRLLFSWEIFPFKVGIAISFAWESWANITSYTLYHPEWGFDQSIEFGTMNYHHLYGKQLPKQNGKSSLGHLEEGSSKGEAPFTDSNPLPNNND